MATETQPFHPAAPWLWAFFSLLWWFVSLVLALPVGGLVLGVGGLRYDLAAVLAVNGAASLAGVQLLGRAVLGGQLRPRGGAVALPFIGLALAIAAELALHEWAEARFGYYDAEMVWWTAGLAPTLVLVAVAAFGVLIAPPRALAPPLAGLALAVAGVLFIVASNVPGLRDGLDADSWPLASFVGLSGLYALNALVLGVWRARGG